jgi:hypothetical protein
MTRHSLFELRLQTTEPFVDFLRAAPIGNDHREPRFLCANDFLPAGDQAFDQRLGRLTGQKVLATRLEQAPAR